jgi:hypothetical protein
MRQQAYFVKEHAERLKEIRGLDRHDSSIVTGSSLGQGVRSNGPEKIVLSIFRNDRQRVERQRLPLQSRR